jgi:2-polyprenyl-3-methyl-5-hydroxy-6-metoxy-1,4-benzoquinol methylase
MNFLFVPLIGYGNGIGHLHRCIELAKETENSSLFIDASDYTLIQEYLTKSSHGITIIHSVPEKKHYDYIFFDKRKTGMKDLEFFSQYGTPIGIDEGGETRPLFPYLIDILPGPRPFCEANTKAPFILNTGSENNAEHDIKRLFIAFGGEDPYNLTELVYHYLVNNKIIEPDEISVLKGPLKKKFLISENTELIDSPENLSAVFQRFSIVITSYGLSAFEAANAGCGVILLNPTGYHEKLSRLSGFITTGKPKSGLRKLPSLLKDIEELIKRSSIILDNLTESKTTWKQFISNLNTERKQNECPACRSQWNASIGRFFEKTYFQCSRCGLIYMHYFTKRTITYSDSYFFSEYKSQYGKTYLEDFNLILKQSMKRLKSITSMMCVTENSTVLDVGCAYGPFLAAAAYYGLKPYGIDISSGAVDYVKNKLNYPAEIADFKSFQPEAIGFPDQFDIITMWFVLEHFPFLQHILRKVFILLKPGGIFAFSTPNSSGISGISNKKQFLKQSPEDHFIITNPSSAKKILKRNEFIETEIRITGHHPERFFGVKKKDGIRYNFTKFLSRSLRLGDTFECYTKRNRE